MLRLQRAAWAGLQGYVLKPELMTNAQGQSQAHCASTQSPQGTYLGGLKPVLVFSMAVLSQDPWRLTVI